MGLGYVVSSIKRAGYNFDLLDLDAHPLLPEETEHYLVTHQYDVVIMGCIVTGYKYVKWLSKTVKEAFPNTKIIVGNTVAQSIPEILLSKTDADIAVMGEGDVTVVEILNCLQTSSDLSKVLGVWYRNDIEIVKNPQRPVIADVDTIPFPDWDLFDVEKYIKNSPKSISEPFPPIPRDKIRAMPVNTARGCPFSCTFCYHVFRGEKYRRRSPQSVIQEMIHHNERYGINCFNFNDELTFFSSPQAEAFADAIIASGLKVFWRADCRSGLFSREEHISVVKKLKLAGCLCLGFSLESADPDILNWMNKKASAEDFSRQVQILKKGGIASLTSLVFGFPNETEATIKATIDVCIENGIYPSAGYLLPQPGSEMYDYAVKQGFIADDEDYLLSMGDRQDLLLNMTQMSDTEFETILKRELERCAKTLNIGLDYEHLLKTGHYRSKSETIDKLE